jgi:hypothetical protein
MTFNEKKHDILDLSICFQPFFFSDGIYLNPVKISYRQGFCMKEMLFLSVCSKN